MAMMLPTKQQSLVPVATTDTAWNQLAGDPSIPEIPKGSAFGAAPAASREAYSAQQDQSKSITSSGGAMHGGVDVLVEADDKFGKFINSKWRPLFAMMYLVACTCDFVLFPILWSVLQAMSAGQVTSQWQPLTIQGGGLFHIACGAVLGIAAYGRTQEKVAGKA
jgi:hypothetical protein